MKNETIRDKEEVRQAVRERYAKVAKNGSATCLTGADRTCDGEAGPSGGESRKGSCCGSPEVTPEQISGVLGYSEEEMGSVPEGANLGLGCGNPVALASLETGDIVVDLGSGGGFDCFLASKAVGEGGRVIGVDMTPDMVTKARVNREKVGASNVEFRLGEIEHLPVADNTADVIMSNCVINLSPDKPQVYGDAFRVLKPGGRLGISDIVATQSLPEEIARDLAAVTACIGGAATVEDTEQMLRNAGFQEIKIHPKEESRQAIRAWFPESRAGDYVVSAYIEARKPA